MTPAEKRPNRGRWAVGIILAGAVVLLLLGGLLAWQPAVLLRAGLSLAGHDEVTFDQLRVGLHGLELTGLAIGARSDQRPPDHLVGRLKIDYRPRDLLRGRIEEVSVEGLRLRGRLDQAGVRLEALDGTVAGGDEPAALPAVPMPQRVSIRDARLELTTPVGIVAVPFEAQVRPERDRAVFTLDAERAELAAATGQLRADLHLEGEMPLDPQSFAGDVTASGRAELRAEGLAVPGVAGGVGGSGALAFTWQRGRLDASLSNVRAQLAAIAPEWDAIAELLPAPWRLELAQPVHISADPLDDGIRLEGSGRLALSTAGPQLNAALSTTVGLDKDWRVRELTVTDGKLDVRDGLFADMRLERGAIRLAGAGSLEAWEGSVALDLAGSGAAPITGLMLDGATLRAGLTVRFADGRLSASLREPGALQAAALRWGEGSRVDRVDARLQPGSAPLLSADLADGAVAWQQSVIATLSPFDAVTSGRTPLRLRAQADELRIELAGDRRGLATGRIVLSGGDVRAPAQEVRASGIAAEVGLSAEGLAPNARIPVSVASIAHEGKPPWFAPLRLDGSLQPQRDRIAFDLALGPAAGDLRMRVRGQHELARAAGRAEIKLTSVEFAPGRLQPAALAPALGDAIRDVSGRLALDGGLTWGARGGGADLNLLLEDLTFSSGPARFERVNGVIAFDRLAPLSTPPGQQLSVGLVDIGLPLTNGLLTFDLEPGQLIVEQARWHFAEGRIRAAPFTIGSGEMRFSTTLTAERLQLDEIFALAQLEGLTGEGTMHGTLPITVAGAEAVIRSGELVSDRPGWVRYRPDRPPAALQAGGENVNLLLQALQNFRYQELRLTIDGRTDGDMDVRLHIKGANPDLYDGYPIEFNLNLEGALADVVRAGLSGYQIPDRIRERMQGFGR